MRSKLLTGITAIGFLGLGVIGADARADIVTVTGTSRIDTVFPDTRLATAGISLAAGQTVGFSYAYDTCTMAGAAPFVVTGAGSTLSGDDAFASEFPGFDDGSGPIDLYQAGGFETRNGLFTSYFIELQDFDHNLLALGADAYLDMLPAWEETRFLVGFASSDYPADGWGWQYVVEGDVTALSSTVSAGPPCAGPNNDLDGDGVTNDKDQCASTVTGDVVDANGCSVADLVPCTAPLGSGAWKTHGDYVSAVGAVARAMFKAGLITAAQRDAIIGQAAASGCGK